MERGKRSSNFELLRIAAMLMIIMFHMVQHVIYRQMTNWTYMTYYNNGLFNNPVVYKQLYIPAVMTPLGLVGNGLFIMISGYFTASKSKLNAAKVGKKLLEQMACVSLLLVVGSAVLFKRMNSELLELIPVTIFLTDWWFVGYYFCVLLIATVFLNRRVVRLDQEKYSAFLVILLAVVQFGWSGNLADNLASGLRILLNGIFLYYLGGYIHRYNPFQKVRGYVLVLLIAASYFLVLMNYHNITLSNIEKYLQQGSADTFLQSAVYYDNFSIVVTIHAVALFEIFRRIRIPHSRLINFIGGATFIIYPLHENALVHSLWNMQDWITVLYNEPVSFLGQFMLVTVATFFLGTLIYCGYLGLKWVLSHFRWIFVKESGTELSEQEII